MEGEEIPANLLDDTSTHQAGVSKQKPTGSTAGHT